MKILTLTCSHHHTQKQIAMKPVSSFLNKFAPALIFLAALASACTNVYFENPVPQRGERVPSAPSDLTGVYLLEPGLGETLSEWEELLRPCFRIEGTDDGGLLVSTENRLLVKDLPRLKKALENQKREGKLLNYRMTESAILCTLQIEEEGITRMEEQAVALIKSGSWYILAQSAQPYRLFDFKAGRHLEYKPEENAPAKTDWLPGANRLQADTAQLVARKQDGSWYFNTRKNDENGWSLTVVERAPDGSLLVKFSSLDNRNAFEERAAYYNAITPFRKDGDNRYRINPTDEALSRLVREEGLFESARLKKME